MKQRSAKSVTPQAKIINTNDRFGNQGIKRQQGTTRIIYDSLPLDGADRFPFFEESNNRNFPFTNMGSRGGELGVGETLVFERTYLVVVEDDGAAVPAIFPVTIADFPGILTGEMNLAIANTQVLKPIPLLSFASEFNKSAYHQNYSSFEFDTQIILIPLVEFVSNIRVVRQPAIADTFLRLTFEGVGSILAPRQTM